MQIPWKLKSFLFAAIDIFGAAPLLYFLQKYVTRRSSFRNFAVAPAWKTHKAHLKKYNATGLVFEFGAGKSLAQNLFVSDLTKKQIVIDLNPMIDLNLVNQACTMLRDSINFRAKREIRKITDLEYYGIQYIAPADASRTNFVEKSIDACISTNTLEHIPMPKLEEIFLELYRILKDDGIISAKIDYSDHYAHTDKSISSLHFLKFHEDEWKKYNHKCHFQNRLRHYQFLTLFEKCGFILVEEELVFCEGNLPSEIIRAFECKPESWKAISAHVVLKKAK